MKIVKRIILIIIIALGISSGIAKVLLIPGEMEFFTGAGFSETLLIVFGFIQIVAGILIMPKKYRMLGATILAVTFCISTVLIFLNGQVAFGFFSILPILLSLVIITDKNWLSIGKVIES